MSKNPIEWHEECLNNHKIYLEQRHRELVRMQEIYCADFNSYEFYSYQIGQAKREEKDWFDRDKYLKKQKSSGTSDI